MHKGRKVKREPPIKPQLNAVRCHVFWSHGFASNLAKMSGGMTMTGMEEITRVAAVWATANLPAIAERPMTLSSLSLMRIPSDISTRRIRPTLKMFATATAANGTKRVSVARSAGEKEEEFLT